MTRPDLLRLGRACAKWRVGFLLVAFLGLSTAAASVQHLAPPRRAHWTVLATGDTIIVRLTFTAGARATGARWTVQAALTNGTWTGLPIKAVTTSATSATMTVSAVPWDSASFVPILWGTQGALVSKDSIIGPVLKLRRPPGPPTVPLWDTSATVIGLLAKPDRDFRDLTGQFVCVFVKFSDGKVARRTVDAAQCDTIAARVFTVAERSVTLMQQRCADTVAYCANPGSGLQSTWLNRVRLAVR